MRGILVCERGAGSEEREAGISYLKYFNFLLPWQGRPITVVNVFRKNL
jgi:hypothetical protein